MIRFCGRCGRIFNVLDIVLVQSGKIARHYVYCPTQKFAWNPKSNLSAHLANAQTASGGGSVRMPVQGLL